ncbi:TBC1 domain family member 2B-like isoform X2 [Mytilus californianus]|uniref:TBC1 domain family member 2B-like isoform X2 n=1 Tax=Mytilus californianus TaxID=6549 RepID=UPI0022486EDE|nr:TBC1 domain family member 2B-like isoform X2 [Mytilus californianus]
MEVEVGGPDSADKNDTLIKPSAVKATGQFIKCETANENAKPTENEISVTDRSETDEKSENTTSKYPEGKLCGWLTIIARGIIKTNRQRWCVYGDKTCKLYYYRSQNDIVPLGEIDISRATFHFEPTVDKPGAFQIRSDNREHVLDAANRHAMMYWLQELQKRRRIYNSNQSTKLTRPVKRPQRLSGLDMPKLDNGKENDGQATEKDLSPSSTVIIPEIVVPSYSPLSVCTGKLGGSKVSKPSPSPSSSSTTSEDWTLLDTSEHGKSLKSPNPQNKIMNAFSKIKAGKKGNNSTLPTDNQVCHRCKQLQSQLSMSKEEHHSTEDELQAHREIVRILQKELDKLSRDVYSRNEADDKDREGLLKMVAERDKHITELQYSIVNLKEEKEHLSQKLRSIDGETRELSEQVTMYQDMLKAKDDTIIQLTNEITALEKEMNNNQTNTQNSDDVKNSENTRQSVIVVSDTLELARLKDMCQAYELQNKFLTKEILELNYLRQNDQANEKALMMSNAKLEAQYFQTRSKYLVLFKEIKKPRQGEEVNQPDDVVSQLLKEAMAFENDEPESIEFQLTSSGQEYDRYGFVKRYGEDEEEIDPLAVKAEQLERHSEEINNKIKDAEEIQSFKLRWENFMVGLGVKPLTRSSELKTLIRMGIPNEYREQIWKGCVNFYVGEIRDKLGPHYYKELANKTKNASLSPETKQIELDLLRTLPNNRHYESIENEGIEKLRNVLLSYSVHNPMIGYCQGLNRLAAISLLFLPEEEAFWNLVAIVDFLMPRDYYSKTLLAAQVDQRVLKDLLHDKLPRLYNHFEQLDVDISLFTFNWFLTIFIDNIPTGTFLRIWDSFLYEGSKVLFRFAVAFFKCVEEDILDKTTALQLNHFMRVMGDKMNNPKQICQLAFNWINPFPMRMISTRRQFHLQHVKNELAELDRMRGNLRDNQRSGGDHDDSSGDDQ